jgi:hypothetical protein
MVVVIEPKVGLAPSADGWSKLGWLNRLYAVIPNTSRPLSQWETRKKLLVFVSYRN